MLLLLLFNDRIWSKSLIQHRIITFWMLCRLQHRFFWNECSSFCVLYFGLLRWTMILLWAKISVRCLDYPIFTTKHFWPTFDPHVQEGATKISCTVFAVIAATTWNTLLCYKATLWLLKMHKQKSLTLLWGSFGGWGTVRGAVDVAPKGVYYLVYRCLQSGASLITHNAKPKIIDALLTLNSRMGQWPCR